MITPLRIDYRDIILVFVNGTLVFKENNAFRAKGIQYTGHLDISTNSLFVLLLKGTNQIHCEVIEKANGWGLIGKIE